MNSILEDRFQVKTSESTSVHARLSARLFLIACLVVIPLLYLCYQAFWDPKINFLPISLNAEWALHPIQEVQTWGTPVSKDAVFRTEFDREAIGPNTELVCRAFTEMTIVLNGTAIYQSPAQHNWKNPVAVDMSRALKAGTNVIEIKIDNGSSVPALLVENPPVLRTRGKWKVSLAPAFSEFQQTVSPLSDGPPAPLDSAVYGDPGPFYAKGSQLLPKFVLVWLLLTGVLGVCLLPLVWKKKPAKAETSLSGFAGIAISLLILEMVLLLHLSNALHYPVNRDPFDTGGHFNYVNYVYRTWRMPHANDGWEMYQPPLYYYAAAMVYAAAGGERRPNWSIKAIQLFGAVIAWGLQVVTWLCLRQVFPRKPWAQCMALLFSAFVPMALYTSPLISNESFAAVMIALSIYAFILLGKTRDISVLGSATSGFLVGLALLSKYTGFFIFLSGALFLFLRALTQNNRRSWKVLGSYLGAVLLIAGWFYLRNISEYHNPFIGNWDRATGFQYHQNPGYRSAEFYFVFGKVFFHHPERAPWISWADGNYASMWGDVYRALLNLNNSNAYSWVVLQLLLAVLPSLAILLGFLATARSVWLKPDNNIDLLFIAFSTWLGLSLVSFTLELPFGSTIKAFFALSVLPVFAVYVIRGRQIFDGRSRWLSVLLDLDLVALACLSISLYRA